MSLVVNNNMMAANTARNLNAHYGRLATSTQRLSSGLRVNSAADDAAGLAIRELQRADIAALHQGARNANDAISMIQVADGSLGIIDEKLIRMKELAEQAATGTYDSTQRLMIESEYQAMASEITRIANATDFNGTRLLDGTLSGDHDGSKLVSEGKIKIHFGTGNDSAEDYYYIEIGECTSEAFGLGNNSTWKDVQRRGAESFKDSLIKQIKNSDLNDKDKAIALEGVDDAVKNLNAALTNATHYKQAFKYWATTPDKGFMEDGKNWVGNSSLMADYLAAAASAENITAGPTVATEIIAKINNAINDAAPTNTEIAAMWPDDPTDQAAISRVQQEIYNKITIAAKDAASEAGLYDSEIKTMMEALDAAWYTPPTDPADPTTGTDNRPTIANTDTTPSWDTTELTALTKAVEDSLSAKTDNGSTIAQNAALRNQAKVDYAAAETKPAVGPTDAAQIVRDLKKGLEDAWKNAEDLGDPKPDTWAGYSKTYDAIKESVKQAALKAGFSEAEFNEKIGDEFDNLVADPLKVDDLKDLTKDVDPDVWDGGFKDGLIAVLDSLNDGTVKGEAPLADSNYAEYIAVRNQGRVDAKAADKLDEFWNGLRDTEKQKLQYAWGQAAIYNLAHADENREIPGYGFEAKPFDFKTVLGLDKEGFDSNFIDNDMLEQAFKDMEKKVGHMDFAGYTIETQEDAQNALDAINEAIVSKDKIRAHLGAAQNRLENTVSNLNIQAENLQAAESRISDVDVATEMTQFVRNQILTQSAVAMLSQANSLPQMAMQLIGG